jgi:hypothetical protein
MDEQPNWLQWIVLIIIILVIFKYSCPDTDSLASSPGDVLLGAKRPERLLTETYDWGSIPVHASYIDVLYFINVILEEHHKTTNISTDNIQVIIDDYLKPAFRNVSQQLVIDGTTDHTKEPRNLHIGDVYDALQKCLDKNPMQQYTLMTSVRFWELVFFLAKYQQSMFVCEIISLLLVDIEPHPVFSGISYMAKIIYPDDQEKQRLLILASVIKHYHYVKTLIDTQCPAIPILKSMEEVFEGDIAAFGRLYYEREANVVFQPHKTITHHEDPFWIDWIQRCTNTPYSKTKAVIETNVVQSLLSCTIL